MSQVRQIEVRRIVARAVCGALYDRDPNYVCDDSCFVMADRIIAELGAFVRLPLTAPDGINRRPVRALPVGHSG